MEDASVTQPVSTSARTLTSSAKGSKGNLVHDRKESEVKLGSAAARSAAGSAARLSKANSQDGIHSGKHSRKPSNGIAQSSSRPSSGKAATTEHNDKLISTAPHSQSNLTKGIHSKAGSHKSTSGVNDDVAASRASSKVSQIGSRQPSAVKNEVSKKKDATPKALSKPLTRTGSAANLVAAASKRGSKTGLAEATSAKELARAGSSIYHSARQSAAATAVAADNSMSKEQSRLSLASRVADDDPRILELRDILAQTVDVPDSDEVVGTDQWATDIVDQNDAEEEFEELCWEMAKYIIKEAQVELKDETQPATDGLLESGTLSIVAVLTCAFLDHESHTPTSSVKNKGEHSVAAKSVSKSRSNSAKSLSQSKPGSKLASKGASKAPSLTGTRQESASKIEGTNEESGATNVTEGPSETKTQSTSKKPSNTASKLASRTISKSALSHQVYSASDEPPAVASKPLSKSGSRVHSAHPPASPKGEAAQLVNASSVKNVHDDEQVSHSIGATRGSKPVSLRASIANSRPASMGLIGDFAKDTVAAGTSDVDTVPVSVNAGLVSAPLAASKDASKTVSRSVSQNNAHEGLAPESAAVKAASSSQSPSKSVSRAESKLDAANMVSKTGSKAVIHEDASVDAAEVAHHTDVSKVASKANSHAVLDASSDAPQPQDESRSKPHSQIASKITSRVGSASGLLPDASKTEKQQSQVPSKTVSKIASRADIGTKVFFLLTAQLTENWIVKTAESPSGSKAASKAPSRTASAVPSKQISKTHSRTGSGVASKVASHSGSTAALVVDFNDTNAATKSDENGVEAVKVEPQSAQHSRISSKVGSNLGSRTASKSLLSKDEGKQASKPVSHIASKVGSNIGSRSNSKIIGDSETAADVGHHPLETNAEIVQSESKTHSRKPSNVASKPVSRTASQNASKRGSNKPSIAASKVASKTTSRAMSKNDLANQHDAAASDEHSGGQGGDAAESDPHHAPDDLTHHDESHGMDYPNESHLEQNGESSNEDNNGDTLPTKVVSQSASKHSLVDVSANDKNDKGHHSKPSSRVASVSASKTPTRATSHTGLKDSNDPSADGENQSNENSGAYNEDFEDAPKPSSKLGSKSASKKASPVVSKPGSKSASRTVSQSGLGQEVISAEAPSHSPLANEIQSDQPGEYDEPFEASSKPQSKAGSKVASKAASRTTSEHGLEEGILLNNEEHTAGAELHGNDDSLAHDEPLEKSSDPLPKVVSGSNSAKVSATGSLAVSKSSASKAVSQRGSRAPSHSGLGQEVYSELKEHVDAEEPSSYDEPFEKESKPASKAVSRSGSGKVSVAGSRIASKVASKAASTAVSKVSSKLASKSASRTNSQSGIDQNAYSHTKEGDSSEQYNKPFEHSSKPSSKTASKAGSIAASRARSNAASKVVSKVASKVGSRAISHSHLGEEIHSDEPPAHQGDSEFDAYDEPVESHSKSNSVKHLQTGSNVASQAASRSISFNEHSKKAEPGDQEAVGDVPSSHHEDADFEEYAEHVESLHDSKHGSQKGSKLGSAVGSRSVSKSGLNEDGHSAEGAPVPTNETHNYEDFEEYTDQPDSKQPSKRVSIAGSKLVSRTGSVDAALEVQGESHPLSKKPSRIVSKTASAGNLSRPGSSSKRSQMENSEPQTSDSKRNSTAENGAEPTSKLGSYRNSKANIEQDAPISNTENQTDNITENEKNIEDFNFDDFDVGVPSAKPSRPMTAKLSNRASITKESPKSSKRASQTSVHSKSYDFDEFDAPHPSDEPDATSTFEGPAAKDHAEEQDERQETGYDQDFDGMEMNNSVPSHIVAQSLSKTGSYKTSFKSLRSEKNSIANLERSSLSKTAPTSKLREVSTDSRSNQVSVANEGTANERAFKRPQSSRKPIELKEFDQMADAGVQHPNEINYVGIVASLRREISGLKKEMGIRDDAIVGLKEREHDLKSYVESSKTKGKDTIDKNTRILLDRQKKAYQILVAKLRREVRRLNFQKNSLSDPLIESKYFPYLPRTPFGSSARNPPIGIIGNLPQRSSDYFPLNPPPPTGNHIESGNRWWWGSGPDLSSHRESTGKRPSTVGDGAPEQNGADVKGQLKMPLISTRLQQLIDDYTQGEAKVGDRGCVLINGERVLGMVKYVGLFDPYPESGLWCGIKLDRPLGKHDGVVRGKRYFSCEENHGLFVKLDKIIPMGPAGGKV
ncbi:CAP-Gly domain-containing linker protein 2 [Chytriomyces hyalinus]|nr:CAP-Gly domain-containing linker protein 2 [Chytriomyces hyalinus]